MKKKLLLLIPLLAIIFLTGCTKKSITVEEFISSFDTSKYKVEKNDSLIENINSKASAGNTEFQIEFYEMKDKSHAEELFKKQKEEFNSVKTSVSAQNSIKSNNYESYELITNGRYMYNCRVDNTIIYVNANEKDKDEVKSLIDKIGY